MQNALKLLAITTITLLVSGYLFYQGLKPELEKNEQVTSFVENLIPITVQPSPAPVSSPDVLGNTASLPTVDEAVVVKIVDGDTIEVDYQSERKKLRYIGINTPETVDPRKGVECFGKKASEENKRLLEGKTVVLEKDVSETDKFGRLLRYVFLPLEDGTKLFINDYLVRGGFAYASSYPPDIKYANRFLEAQKEAQESLRGLWASCK